MADTPRTLAALQALLADNSAGSIGAKDLRDVLVSVLGEYACLSVFDSGAIPDAQTDVWSVPLADVFGVQELAANNMTTTVATKRLTVATDGDYLIWLHVSFSITVNNNTIFWGVAKNGTALPNIKSHQNCPSANNSQTATVVAIVPLVAGDYLQPISKAGVALTPDLNLLNAQFGALRIK